MLSLSLSFGFSQTTSAAQVLGFCNNGGASSTVCQDAKNNKTTSNPVISIIKTVIQIVSYLIGIVAVVIIIISGLRMILGGGDPQTINSARMAIIYALIGILVAVAAEAIVVFVLDKLK